MNNRLNRREFTALVCGGALGAQSDRRPNFLFLLTDDQRFDTIRALGNREIFTPNMDRLAQRGTTFTHACIMGGTQPAVCLPSRAMLLSGETLFHAQRDIADPKADLSSPRFTMFPEHLRKHGYTTFGTGKWHNREKTFARCFEHASNVYFGEWPVDHLTLPVADFDPQGTYPKAVRRVKGKFSSELFSDAAVEFLDRYRESRPFCMYVAYWAPHDPRMAPARFQEMYPAERISLPRNFLPEHPFDNGELKVRDEMLAPFPRTPEVVRKHIADYYAMITEVDEQIGRILDALQRGPHASNTVVILTADNGLSVGRHGLMGKQNLYDESVRVPLILSGPGIRAGIRCDSLCYLSDLFPTMCEMAAVSIPKSVEGRSLMPALRQRSAKIRDAVFLAYRNIQRGVRTDRWKLIVYQVGGKRTVQLFDLRNDPLEMHDLAVENRHANTRATLHNLLRRYMKELDDPEQERFA